MSPDAPLDKVLAPAIGNYWEGLCAPACAPHPSAHDSTQPPERRTVRSFDAPSRLLGRRAIRRLPVPPCT